MTQSLYPEVKKDILEVMDSCNTPLCLMPKEEILRQKLYHRRTALLLRERTGKYLLTFRADDGWGLSSVEFLPAGYASAQQAEDLLLHHWQHTGIIHALGILPACPENTFSFIEVFTAYLPTSRIKTALRTPEQHMLVDQDELHGLKDNFSDLLSPTLYMTIQTFLAQIGGRQQR